jgi:molybdenum cofactor cytidylyltransferase
MGEAKLLLPWGDSTVIQSVIAAWRKSSVRNVIVVVSPSDARLADVCRAAGATAVVPSVPPPEMKDSLRAAIIYSQPQFERDTPPDCFLVAPADMPWLAPAIIDQLLAAFAATRDEIVIPTYAGRRGHPIVVPWSLAEDVLALAEDESLKTIVERHTIQTLECNATILGDLDTPEDYIAARQRWQK